MDRLLTANLITTVEAASRLGYSLQHTRLLMRKGLLQATKFGRDWLVLRESVESYGLKQGRFWPEEAEASESERISQAIVNVASVPQRSPFRYPGGKTWLVPRVRLWLRSRGWRFRELVEPFAGGGIVGLTAAFEDLADRVTLVELDDDVASVWKTILNGNGHWLADKIRSFDLSPENIRQAIANSRKSVRQRAFATIVRNRISRGGILAPGAGVVKKGENGKGLSSRWYPTTLRRRIEQIVATRHRIRFLHKDGIDVLRQYRGPRRVAFFIDPPYTVAGRRLYRHSEIDHEELFYVASRLSGDVLMTYDDADEIRQLAIKYGLQTKTVPMKTTHHRQKMEMLIGRDLEWLDG